jgi:hypothetical protein
MSKCLDRLRQLVPSIRREQALNAGRAAKYLQAEVREDLAVPGSESAHSRPGQFPRRITGDYQLSWTAKVLAGRSIVLSTTASQLMHWLTEGTSRMAPRLGPQRTVERTRPRVLEILRGR